MLHLVIRTCVDLFFAEYASSEAAATSTNTLGADPKGNGHAI